MFISSHDARTRIVPYLDYLETPDDSQRVVRGREAVLLELGLKLMSKSRKARYAEPQVFSDYRASGGLTRSREGARGHAQVKHSRKLRRQLRHASFSGEALEQLIVHVRKEIAAYDEYWQTKKQALTRC